MQAPNGSQQSDLPAMAAAGGFRTPYGIILPPGGKVAAYVRSTGIQSNDDQFIQANWVSTLNAGLARVRSGLGDTVVCLPGHSESVTDSSFLSNLVAGTVIVGVGYGSNMPVFRWTAAGSQWALNKADVCISGLRLRLEGANGVTKAILVTAADNVIRDCDIEVSSGAANLASIALEVGAGATRFRLVRSKLRGLTGATVDGVKIVSAVDGVEIGWCTAFFPGTETNGQIHVTAAATNLDFHDLRMANTVANSTVCVVYDDVACTGVLSDCRFSTLNNGTASSQGVAFGTGALIRVMECYSTDEPKKSGILAPTAGT